MNSRPWYISFTAIWKDMDNFTSLQTEINASLQDVPFNHIQVKEKSWHFTVLPLLKVSRFAAAASAEEYMLTLLRIIVEAVAPNGMQLPALDLEAYETTAFDSGTCLQFRGVGNSLEIIRGILTEQARPTVERLLLEHEGLETELHPPNRKNQGNYAYGSIARSLTSEGNTVRWRRTIDPPMALTLRKIYLLASDEFLSNPAAHDFRRRKEIELCRDPS